jgi:hypothetical protein
LGVYIIIAIRIIMIIVILSKVAKHKCPEVKSKDFKSQEKRERKVGKTVGAHAVGGEGHSGHFL